jgi:hypothetical protein
MDVKEQAAVIAMINKKVDHDKKEAQKIKNNKPKKPHK